MPSELERVPLEHLPPDCAVYAVLFRGVANAAALQAQLVARNPAFEYAFIDATTVLGRMHFLAAVYKAVLAQAGGTLKTPNVHSETVLSLSPSHNIAEAYRRYGVTADTEDVLVVKILFAQPADTDTDTTRSAAAGAVWAHLQENVQGTPQPPTDTNLGSCTDLDKTKKYYKLNGVPSLAGRDDTPAKRREAEVLALSAMALRGL